MKKLVSRRRQQQRDNKKELARQLGVAGRAVPQHLLDNERVTEPSMGLSLVVDRWPTVGVLARLLSGRPAPRTLHLHALLWCVSSQRAVLVRSLRAHAHLASAGPVAVVIDAADDHGHESVRYRRPGSFVLLAVVCEGRGDVDPTATHQALLTTTALPIETAQRPIAELTNTSTPTPVELGLPSSWGSFVVAKAAADRVKEQLTWSVTSTDGTVSATVAVALRL
jgi:hypothetical protein